MGLLDIFKKTNEKEVRAVHGDDLENYLKSVGFFEKVKEGKTRCVYCGNKITIENLEVTKKAENGEIKMVCSNPRCTRQIKL
jgi:adenylate cyclase class IV